MSYNKDMKNKINLEKLLYIFVLLNPILDMLSGKFYIDKISITMVLRPLIPFFCLIYIFIKDNSARKKLLIGGLIYILYSLVHLYLYYKNVTLFSYGNTIYEATYLLNYTYLIFSLYLFIYVFKNIKDTSTLYKCLFIHNMIYIVSILIAIITNTSNSTYTEGIGFIGWFNTGGAVGSILVISLLLLLPKIFEDKKNLVIKIFYLISTYAYLIFLLGTRVGLFGAVLTIVVFLISNVVISIIKKVKLNRKVIIISSCALVLFVVILYIFGSMTINRRKMLDELTGKNPFDETAPTIYMAYDFTLLKEKLESGVLEENYLNKEQKSALFKLDEYTKRTKFVSTDLRGQQLLYHTFLYMEQKDIALKLFGNGYLINMGALTLEMETIALFYNFGIIGFILFFIPFLVVLLYGIFIGIKNIKKIDVE